MARELVFKLNDTLFNFSPEKVERKKLYGWTETVALDDDGNECRLVSMDESGTVIIPKGCIGMGTVSSDMRWVEKSELMAVDSRGNAVELLPSSFSVTIELDSQVSNEYFLDHSIISVYELDGDNLTDFIEKIKDKIYTFTFNYREGYEGNPAFILESEGKAFILVGLRNDFSFVGLEEAGYIEECEDEEELSDELGIDFSMM